jgi:hypothetical protein
MKYVKTTAGRIYTTETPENWKEATVLTKTEGEKLYREQCRKDLLKMVKPGQTVYTVLRSCSKSGMSRRISLHIVDKKDQQDITYLASVVMKDRMKDGAIVIGGCGMDMGFSLVYNLGHYLWPNGTKKPHGTRNGEADHSGGYALKQSWM